MDLELDIAARGQRVDVAVSGLLSDATAGRLRDGLLKCSADGPDVLVVHVDGLRVGVQRLLSVFSVVARRFADWPGTELVLVCRRPELRTLLARNAISRFVRVVDEAAQVDAAATAPTTRQRAWCTLSRGPGVARAARAFVHETCERWDAPEFTDFATAIISELVENVLAHTTSGPRVRLELRRRIFTVAVTDDSPAPPVLREAPPNDYGLGLRIVGELATVWGCTPTPSGGKVMWAVVTDASLRPNR